ncbi:type III secretion protein [Photobacterium leiognathi]|uniref:type III secretion protein n=1 Tax=Photobacterium leiognathi TaxID=553611 RepID=UPI0029819183|nr:type III secretion protein [Photobacterium leiognathi]
MKVLCFLLFIILTGCNNHDKVQIAKFESSDIANKVIVLLYNKQLPAKLEKNNKEQYIVYVDKSIESRARELLSKLNFYFRREKINDLLESKFASLSQLETIKSNLIESREIYNKLNVIPNVFRASVIVTGEKKKKISIIIISLQELKTQKKNSIEKFLKGVVDEKDTLTVSYFVQMLGNEKI